MDWTMEPAQNGRVNIKNRKSNKYMVTCTMGSCVDLKDEKESWKVKECKSLI
jgi:hypothetical protein